MTTPNPHDGDAGGLTAEVRRRRSHFWHNDDTVMTQVCDFWLAAHAAPVDAEAKALDTPQVLEARRELCDAMHSMHHNPNAIIVEEGRAVRLHRAWDAYDSALAAAARAPGRGEGKGRGKMNDCQCSFCEEHRRVNAVIESKSLDALVALVRRLELDAMHANADVAYYRGILDGMWPSATDILERSLVRARAHCAPDGELRAPITGANAGS